MSVPGTLVSKWVAAGRSFGEVVWLCGHGRQLAIGDCIFIGLNYLNFGARDI